MYRDFAILFVYVFVAVSWVFTVTLVKWYEKGPRLGSQYPVPQSASNWYLGKAISASLILSFFICKVEVLAWLISMVLLSLIFYDLILPLKI